jgi:hypothetical protein
MAGKVVRMLGEDGMEGRKQIPGAGELIRREWCKKHKRFK